MNSSSHARVTVVSLKQHGWVCLLLATLLLYNPFLAVPHPGNGLGIGHRASHRATVGASELQHFSPIDGWGSQLAVDSGTTVVVLPLPELSAPLFLALLSTLQIPQQFYGPGRWFRPPPVR